MNDGTLQKEIIYRGYLITVHMIRGGDTMYYASVMELGYVNKDIDMDYCIEHAKYRVDMEYDYNEYS
jgi:hypothetical protein